MKQTNTNSKQNIWMFYLLQTNHFSAVHLVSSQVASVLLSWRQF